VNISIDALGTIVAARVYDEAVVGVYISGLVDGMVARAKTPGRVAPIVPSITMRLVVGWAWRQTKVHEVGNGRLPLAIIEWTHGERLDNSILVRLPESLGAFVLLLLLLRIPRIG
jgi:hypothetical protein